MQDFPVIDETMVAEAPKQRALAIVTSLKDTALAQFNDTEATLKALAERYRDVAFDVSTPAGLKAAKEARHDLRENGRFAVQRVRDRTKKEANDLKRVLDIRASELIALVQPCEDAIDAQVTAREDQIERERAAREQAEAERKAKHEAGLATLRGYVQRAQSLTSERIGNGIAALDAMQFGAEWEEYQTQAEQARDEAAAALRTLQAEVKAREDEAARLEAMRAEQNRIAAEQKAEAARLAAEAAALKRQADELAAQRAEAERQARIAEDARQAKLTAEREAAAAAEAAENTRRLMAVEATSTPEGRDSQHVLKAEPAMADATDRDVPAMPSPVGGPMGAGQPAAAGPAVDAPTIKLGDLNEMLGFTMTAEFVISRMAIPRVQGTKGPAVHIRQSDLPRFFDTLIGHITAVREAA